MTTLGPMSLYGFNSSRERRERKLGGERGLWALRQNGRVVRVR